MRARLRVAWFDPMLTMDDVGRVVGKSATTCRNEAQRLGLPNRTTIRPLGRIPQVQDEAQRPAVRPLRPGERTLPPLPSEIAGASAPADTANTT